MRRLRRPAALLATSALAMTLAACGGGDKPAPTGTAATNRSTTTPTSSTPSPSSTKPDSRKPDPQNYPHMNEKTEAGARATFDYFIDGYRYAMLTGDTSIIEGMSVKSCEPCQGITKEARDKHANISSIAWKRVGTKSETEANDVITTVDKVHSTIKLTSRQKPVKQTIYIGTKLGWGGKEWRIVDASVEPEDA